jgi:hypothetical protein
MRTPLKLLVLLCLSLLLWNCEKQVKYNRIEGTLTPGQDIGQTGLDSIPLVLAKIYDTIDFTQSTFKPDDFGGYSVTLTDAGGFYHFDSLPDGNYVIACGKGFKFADVDFTKITASKGAVYQVNKSVNRLASSNGFESYITEVKNESICRITNIEFVTNVKYESHDIIVEPGNQQAQIRYFNFTLDEAQYPLFAITVSRNDSLFKSPWVPFFGHNFFNTNSSWEITHFYRMVSGTYFKNTIMLMKGWWFGEFIVVYPWRSDSSFNN